MQILENEYLQVTVKEQGAELSSIVNKETGTEYMWNADPAYWKRTAPVLFPVVGSLKQKQFLYESKAYPMGQHGFARDMRFEFVHEESDGATLWYSLKSSKETLEKYPFSFELRVGYHLEGKKLQVMWQVKNTDDKTMYFSIGGHPAFMCPLDGRGKQTDYYIAFDTEKDLLYSKIDENGLVEQENLVLSTEGGMMPVREGLFDEDALIIEHHQAHRVSLCGSDKKPYLTVEFDAPLFGLWSPAGKNAPFICIEPWYGRCDKESFSGTLKEREYGNVLAPGDIFDKSFSILF